MNNFSKRIRAHFTNASKIRDLLREKVEKITNNDLNKYRSKLDKARDLIDKINDSSTSSDQLENLTNECDAIYDDIASSFNITNPMQKEMFVIMLINRLNPGWKDIY